MTKKGNVRIVSIRYELLSRVAPSVLCTVLWVFAAFPQSLHAQEACPGPPVAPTAVQMTRWIQMAPDQGFLREIEKDDRKSWLFGTVHLAKMQWLAPGPKTIAALRAADTIAVEVDLTDPGLGEQLSKSFTESKKKDASLAIPIELHQRLERLAVANCIGKDALAALPWSLKIVTTLLSTARRDGLEANYSIDGFLAGFAHATGKHVVSLESMGEQLGLIEQLFSAQREGVLQELLDTIESGKALEQLILLTEAWRNSDWPKISSYLQWCECARNAEELEQQRQLNDARNPGLADGIDALHMAGRKVFAGIGSLHLTGRAPVQELLRAKGYRVTLIRNEP